MGRSPCCEKAHTNKGAWTKEEARHCLGATCGASDFKAQTLIYRLNKRYQT
ncbi:unnamed protein product [Musa acuminata subsp. malaccensis]|uniref:(wild Malaysian banana) hypothetical protein n=1 Tax=Musa acuminata subsp. malaccensis TaxID=214687 RepID=A0A804KUU9_MUSAM|nr:unnamed protein product [Musa acuminata subsp. malaccensis]